VNFKAAEATSVQSQSTTRVRRSRAVIAAVVSACAAWLLIEGLGEVDLRAPASGGNASGQDIGLLGVLFASLAASLAGWLALGLIERYTARPGRWWVSIAAVAFVLSLGGPMSGTGIDNTDRALLVLLHLVVAVVLIPLLYRTIDNRAETTNEHD